MARVCLAAALTCAMVSVGFAKDVCVQIQTGNFVGSTIRMTKVKTGKGTFGPVHGYIDYPISTPWLGPVSGQAMVSSAGDLVVGLTWHVGMLEADGTTHVGVSTVQLHVVCRAGVDGKLAESDACETDGPSTGRIISCKDVAQVP